MGATAYHEDTRKLEDHEDLLVQERRRVLPVLRGFVMNGWWLVALMVLCARVASAETIDRVLAVVSGQLITLTDVMAARDLGLQTGDGSDPVRVILTKLIDRELVLTEVERYAPPEPTADAVDREVQRVRARFASSQALDAALARSGIDERHLRETLRQDLRMAAYMNQRFTASDDRRRAAIDEWMAGLRRRADVIDLYLTPTSR
jgi:hypothetical protein